jgi:branched-chain amino acid transport system permease protein
MTLLTDQPGPLPVPRHFGWGATGLRNAWPVLIGLPIVLGLHFGFGAMYQGYATKLAIDVGIAIVLAVSLNIVNGYTGQFAIGHAGFMMLGGYVAAAITYYGSIRLYGTAQPQGGILSWNFALDLFRGATFGRGEWLFVTAMLAGGLVAALAGLLVGLPSLRLRGDYLAIVTLGFGEIVRVLFEYTFEQVPASQVADTPVHKLAVSLGGSLGFNFAPAYTTIFWTYLVVLLTLVVAMRAKASSLGRAYLSIREDEIAAEAMGVCTTRYKVQAFVISAFFAGLAGALYAHQTPIKAGDLNFMKSFEIIIIIVLGGLGSISGAILAAIVLTLLPELLRDLPGGVDRYRIIIYALVLILVMILRPKGIFGTREIWEMWPFKLLRRKEPQINADTRG